MGSSKTVTPKFENVRDQNGRSFSDHLLINGEPVCGAKFDNNVAKVICRLEDSMLAVDIDDYNQY